MKLFFGLLILISLLGSSFAQRASNVRLVGNVKIADALNGCGCYFKFRGTKRTSQQYMFLETIDEEGIVWMNIDGRDVRLKVGKSWSETASDRVGSKSSRTFAADNITVTSTYVVTRVCAPNDESCESTDYDATFVVRKGKRVETVKATGYCGC